MAFARALTGEAVSSSRIEGEALPYSEVYASVAGRLGLDSGVPPAARPWDGMVVMTFDTVRNHQEPLTAERLWHWHHLLLPSGDSGGERINVGGWRTDRHGPMQVVSAHHDPQRRRVYFQAPEAARVPAEMQAFLTWVNTEQGLDPVVKAALAHLHFLTIHPFDDGNGRIARAISDLLLSRADGQAERYYSLSQIIETRKACYYSMLSRTQAQRSLDVTSWVQWFLEAIDASLYEAQRHLDLVRVKHDVLHVTPNLNERQRTFLERVFAGWDGKLSSQKYARMHGVSADTALRDLTDLVARGVLVRTGEGRGVRYLVPVRDLGRPLVERAPEQFMLKLDGSGEQ
jgi:Fic family protein